MAHCVLLRNLTERHPVRKNMVACPFVVIDNTNINGTEHPYQFSSLEQLIEDFIAEVEKRRK